MQLVYYVFVTGFDYVCNLAWRLKMKKRSLKSIIKRAW